MSFRQRKCFGFCTSAALCLAAAFILSPAAARAQAINGASVSVTPGHPNDFTCQAVGGFFVQPGNATFLWYVEIDGNPVYIYHMSPLTVGAYLPYAINIVEPGAPLHGVHTCTFAGEVAGYNGGWIWYITYKYDFP